jgi:hypothetical protein
MSTGTMDVTTILATLANDGIDTRTAALSGVERPLFGPSLAMRLG